MISVIAELLLAVAIGVAFWTDDKESRLLITGAIISNATTVVGWWVGSSKSSADKSVVAAQVARTLAAK